MDENKLSYMINYNNYAKVCCLKGLDGKSFEYNTGLKADNFELQLERLEKYIKLGFDVYSYIILTCKDCSSIDNKISKLIDRLQEISYYLTLRIIPIKIEKFVAGIQRLNKNKAIEENQYYALNIWNNEIKRRYTKKEINSNIAKLKL